MIRSLLLIFCTGLVLGVTPSLLSATSIVTRTPEALAQESALVVDGKVKGVRSYWNPDHSRILTEATVEVNETHKGGARSQVRVVQLGGVVDNVRMTAHGALGWKTGEEVLLFLESSGGDAFQVAGFSQGKYMIERDRAGRPFVRQASPSDDKGATGPSGAAGATSVATERVSLAQFLNRVLPR